MEKTRIGRGKAKLHKVEFGSDDNYIMISVDDAILFDKFVEGFKSILKMSDDAEKQVESIKKKYKETDEEDIRASMERTSEISRLNVDVSNKYINIVDGIFGDGTVKKYFYDIYKELPDFIPDSDCILDFFEQISPVMEELFGKKVKEREEYQIKKMDKYKPQDHKKPGGKS